MKPPRDHPDEERRLNTLRKLNILDTASEERFDRITRLARRVFQTDIALVSLVDDHRQWFKSRQGLGATETAKSISFCGHAVGKDTALVVEDTENDERFRDNPLVTGAPNIRFYAGHPLRAANGLPMGTLCVIHPKPRAFSPNDALALEDLASLVEAELRLGIAQETAQLLETRVAIAEKKAATDFLTGMWSREFILDFLRIELTRCARENQALSVAMIDLDHFSEVNNQHGHPVGDRVLEAAAQRMRGAIRPYDSVGRYGGEEFLVVLPGASLESAMVVAERVRQRLSVAPLAHSVSVTASIGVAQSRSVSTVDTLVARADKALYASKRAGRDQVCAAPDA